MNINAKEIVLSMLEEDSETIYFPAPLEVEETFLSWPQFKVDPDGFYCEKRLTLYPYVVNDVREKEVSFTLRVSDWIIRLDNGDLAWPYMAGMPYNEEFLDAMRRKLRISDEHKLAIVFGDYSAERHDFITESEYPTHVGILTDAPMKHFAGVNNYNLYEDKEGFKFVPMPKQAALNLVNGIKFE